MPNGWYPVPGLDVVLINRTEQRYPRLEWNQSWDSFWAVEFVGPRGFSPRGQLKMPWEQGDDLFERMVEEVRSLIATDTQLTGTHGSLAYADFKRKIGWAVGSFCVYGFKDGKARVIHDLTLGASIPDGVAPEAWGEDKQKFMGLMTTMIDASGLVFGENMPEPKWRFQFDDVDCLVVSNGPLHYDAHWPPKTSLDCVVIELAKTDRRDGLVALWKEEETSQK